MGNSSNITILLANEDNAINLHLQNLCAKCGFKFYKFNKLEAFDVVYEEIKPDVILINADHSASFNGSLINNPLITKIPALVWGINTRTDFSGFTKFSLIDSICDIEDNGEVLSRISNIISLKKAIDDSNLTQQKIQKLQNDKNELIGIAAHDLKNPIYSISMLAKVIRDDNSLARQDVVEFSNDIIVTAERMLELIKQLLDLNAIEDGKMKLKFEVINILELISATLEIHKINSKNKDINLIFNSTLNEAVLNIDRNAFLQIFDNLVSNAIKFSPSNKTIQINVFESQGNIVTEVKDEGPGLSEDDKKKLFQKFARLSAQPTAGENSTGLGLSIVKKIVEALNGKISVESEPGNGASFRFEFKKL